MEIGLGLIMIGAGGILLVLAVIFLIVHNIQKRGRKQALDEYLDEWY